MKFTPNNTLMILSILMTIMCSISIYTQYKLFNTVYPISLLICYISFILSVLWVERKRK